MTARSESVALAKRITEVLTAAGFTEYQDPPHLVPSFVVSPGVGATVSLHWDTDRHPDFDRAAYLARCAQQLTRDGLIVTHRDRYLYVAEPGPREA